MRWLAINDTITVKFFRCLILQRVFFLLHFGAVLHLGVAATQVQPAPPEPTSHAVDAPTAEGPDRAEPAHSLRFEHLTDEHGLSQNAVFCILQDRRGFMWFGTQDGLNRYDGYNFTVFRHIPGDSTSLSDNYVTALYEDRAGMLWVGTQSGGLNRFNPMTETFFCYRHEPKNPGSLSENYVTAIKEDAEGLWVGTFNHGLNRLNRRTATDAAGPFTRFLHEPQNPYSLSDFGVNSLHIDRRGGLWIGTYNGGLNRYDRATGNFTRFVHDPNNPNTLSNNYVFTIFEDTAGALWLGMGESVLNKLEFDEERRTVKIKRYNCEASVIVEDKDGMLWIGSKGRGLCRFDRTKEQFTRFLHHPNDPFSLSEAGILSAYIDRAGDLWLGTHGYGIDKYSRTRKAFQLYVRTPAFPNSLANRSVRAICEDEQGVLWIGGYDGLESFDRKLGKFTHYPTNSSSPSGLPGKEVFVIYPDPASGGKTFLIGLESKAGLVKYDRAAKRFTPYPLDPAGRRSLIRHPVYKIHRERSGILWVGTDDGLFEYNEAKKELRQYNYEASNPESLSDNRVLDLYEDARGTLWVGTDGGLNRLIRETGRFVRYQHDSHNAFSLSHNRVKCILAGRDGTLWIGTTGGGINHFDPQQERFISYTAKDGLPNDSVYGIVEDEAGDLWVSTNNGLSKFNPRTRTFRNYEVDDGLQGNEFNTGAHFKSKNGEIFFGGINGVTAFYPDRVQDNPYVPPIVLTGFSKFNRPVKLDTAITLVKKIALNYRDAVFSLQFAALSFTEPEKNQYAFRLEGFHDDWIALGTKREATFTQLAPGEYTLHLKGSNNDGVWNETGSRVAIVIAPLFYQTQWFAALGVFMLGFLVYAGYRWRLHRLENRQAELERAVAERTEELRVSETRYRTLVENSPDAIYVHCAGQVLYANPASARLVGTANPEQLIGRPVIEFVAPAHRAVVAERMRRVMQEGVTLPFTEIQGIRLDGTFIHAETMGLPIIYQGQPAAQVIVRDVTARKNLEAQLRQYTENLEKLVEERAARIRELEKQHRETEKLAATGRMAARIAHEINNPLGIIHNAFRLVARAVPAEHRHFAHVDRIEKEIGRIAGIVRQMLDLHRPAVEAPKALRVDETLGDIVALLKPKAQEHGVQIELDSSRAGATMTLPENMLRQILNNVILNAVEASPPQSVVRVTAEIAAAHLRLAVSDQGPGIPAAVGEKIFEPFFTTKSKSTATGGMGLGLSISKNLVEAMQGEITYESQPGLGTTFQIHLPTYLGEGSKPSPRFMDEKK